MKEPLEAWSLDPQAPAAGSCLVSLLDLEGRILLLNRTCEELTGCPAPEARGRKFWDVLVAPEEAEAARQAFEEAVRQAEAAHCERSLRDRHGRRRTIAWNKLTLPAEAGETPRILAVGLDRSAQSENEERMRQAVSAARESDARLTALFETAAQGILVADAQGAIESVNPKLLDMFGYPREELLGQPVEILLPSVLAERHRQHRQEFYRQPKARPMGLGLDLSGRRRDGTQFPVEISLSYIRMDEGFRAVAFINDITARKRAEQALRESESKLRYLTANLVRVQEEERRRVSRELHDDLNQQLAWIAIEVGKREQTPPATVDDCRAWLGTLQERIAKLTEDVRRMAYQLHPAVLDYLGLAAALDAACKAFGRNHGIPVRFTPRNVPARLSDDVSVCLYRVAQECLQNVVKHARTSRAQVTLEGAGANLRLIVEDFGQGFDIESVRQKPGLGLLGIEERVRGLGGSVSVQSEPGEGTRIEVRIEWPGESAAEPAATGSGQASREEKQA